MRNELIILRGHSGAGKTTLAHRLGTVVEADSFPGLYVDGKYQGSLTKASHDYCHERVEQLLSSGVSPVVVSNTGIRLKDVEPYMQMAVDYGYLVRLVHVETSMMPSGLCTKSEHNVSHSTIDRQRRQFEPWHSRPEGVSLEEATEFLFQAVPDLLIMDLDGTLRLTKNGGPFLQGSYDQIINPQVEELKRLLQQNPNLKLAIATNQRGIGIGRKSIEEFREELGYFCELFLAQFSKLPWMIYVATVEGQTTGMDYDPEWDCFGTRAFPSRADKPGYGMLQAAIKDARANSAWFMGNAHKGNMTEDWAAAKAAIAAGLPLTYVPVELFNRYRNSADS